MLADRCDPPGNLRCNARAGCILFSRNHCLHTKCDPGPDLIVVFLCAHRVIRAHCADAPCCRERLKAGRIWILWSAAESWGKTEHRCRWKWSPMESHSPGCS